MPSAGGQKGPQSCADTLERIVDRFDIVVNLQGAAPLARSWFVEGLVAGMRQNSSAQVATPDFEIDGAGLCGPLDDRSAGRAGV